MFSAFDANLPDEIHLSKLCLWLSTHKGAEESPVKVLERSESVRQEVEMAFGEIEGETGTTIPSYVDSPFVSDLIKPKILYTFFDYKECLIKTAKNCGARGEKNVFGTYCETSLKNVQDALAKWESNHLHVLSSSIALTKLITLTYPSMTREIGKISMRVDELTRQISDHDRMRLNYEKKLYQLCQKWDVNIPRSEDAVSIKPKVLEQTVAGQLDKFGSQSYRQEFLESVVLNRITTPKFVEIFLYYHSYLYFLDSKLQCNCVGDGVLPNIQLALRHGKGLNVDDIDKLFRNAPCRNRSSQDSTGSGEDWTHVSALDISEDEVKNVTGTEGVGIMEENFLKQLVDDPTRREVLVNEIIVLREFLHSQLVGVDINSVGGEVNKIDITSILSNTVKYKLGQDEFLHSAIETTQDVLDCFTCDAYLNMVALEDDPEYLNRLRDEIVSTFTKSQIFAALTLEEKNQKAALQSQLAKMKQCLKSLTRNISFLKAALESTLTTSFATSLGQSPRNVTILSDYFGEWWSQDE